MKHTLALLTLVVVSTALHAGPQPSQPVVPRSGEAQSVQGAEALYQRGLQALSAREMEPAKQAFLGALRANQRHVPSMLALAEVAFISKNDSDLRRWLTEAERTEPNNWQVHSALGRFHISREQFPQGEAALAKAVKLEAKALMPRTDLASLYLRRGAADKAVPLLREAIALAPKDARIHQTLGVALAATGNRADGLAMLKRAAELDPQDPLPWLAQAQMASNAAEAAPLIDQVLKRNPLQYDALMLRAGHQYAAKNLSASRQSLEQAAEANPKAADPYVRIGMLAHEAKQTNEARSAYLKALERDANHPLALNNLAMLILENKEDPARAETMARRALRALPNNAQLHDTLAMALVARKDKKGALAAINQAVKLDGQDPQIQLHLAEIQLLNGDRTGALKTVAGLKGKPGLDAARVEALQLRLR